MTEEDWRLRVAYVLEHLEESGGATRIRAVWNNASQWRDNLPNLSGVDGAVLAGQAAQPPPCVVFSERHKCRPWRPDTSRSVPMDAVGVSRALSPVLLRASLIHMVDPYFRINMVDPYSHAGSDQWREYLRTIVSCAGPLTAEIRIHTRDCHCPYSHDKPCRKSGLKQKSFAADLASLFLPANPRVELWVWKERPGGPRFHNRYVLTDEVGVQVGVGLQFRPGSLDTYALLNLEQTDRVCKELDPNTSPYVLCSPG
jgi:hypothetical protein